MFLGMCTLRTPPSILADTDPRSVETDIGRVLLLNSVCSCTLCNTTFADSHDALPLNDHVSETDLGLADDTWLLTVDITKYRQLAVGISDPCIE